MQQIKLSIPEPCHEGWDNMSPTEKGRYCGSCQKEVIDFTGMTDAELFAFFAQKNKGSVCGRTHVGQLETPIAQPVVHKKKRYWYLQYAATFLLLLTKPGSVKSQTKPPITAMPPQPITMGTVAYVQPLEKPNFQIKGTVVDEAGEPIVSASVTIKGHSHGVATDKAGHYQLRVKQKDIITFSAIGYESQTIVANEKDLSLKTVLKSSRSMLEGEIVVVGGLSWNQDDAIGYDVPRYKSRLQVKDKTNNGPLAKAAITIVQTGISKKQEALTNNQGEYLLRKIKANKSYTIIVTAKGYQTKNLLINGSDLKSGNNPKTILMEKEQMAKTLEEVVVTGIKPNSKKSNIETSLAGRMGCGIVQNDATQIIPDLRPNSFTIKNESHTVLQGRLGGIRVEVATPKRKIGFFKKIFSKPGANNKVGTTTLPANTPALVSIYPNPAKINSPIVVAFEKAPKESYRLQLMDIMGKRTQQAQISVPGDDFHFQWALENQVVAGTYVVTVTDAEGKTLLSSKIIVTQ